MQGVWGGSYPPLSNPKPYAWDQKVGTVQCREVECPTRLSEREQHASPQGSKQKVLCCASELGCLDLRKRFTTKAGTSSEGPSSEGALILRQEAKAQEQSAKCSAALAVRTQPTGSRLCESNVLEEAPGPREKAKRANMTL